MQLKLIAYLFKTLIECRLFKIYKYKQGNQINEAYELQFNVENCWKENKHGEVVKYTNYCC